MFECLCGQRERASDAEVASAAATKQSEAKAKLSEVLKREQALAEQLHSAIEQVCAKGSWRGGDAPTRARCIGATWALASW